MSVNIYFGNYQFPSPTPLIAINDSPIYYGKYHTYKSDLSIIGTLTGCSFEELCTAKENFIANLLSQGINIVNIDGNDPVIFESCELTSISFPQTNPTSIWPYEVSMSSLDLDMLAGEKIINPKNSWSLDNNGDGILNISQSISAQGIKTENDDPIQLAKAYVLSKIDTADNYIGAILAGQQYKSDPILISDNENIDEILGSYGRELTYKIDISDVNIKNNNSGPILRCSVSISKNILDFATVNVNGSIDGGMQTPVSKSDFTVDMAFNYANKVYELAKNEWIEAKTDKLNNNPISYEYTENLNENIIQFSFIFNDDPRNEECVLEYSISKSVDDACFSSISVNGSILYLGLDMPDAFSKMEDKLNSTNFFTIANLFYENNNGRGVLNKIPISNSIEKSPTTPSISFQITYDDRLAAPDNFYEFSYSTSINYPIPKISAIETINGYCIFEKNYNSLGLKNVNGAGIYTGDSIEDGKTYVESLIKSLKPIGNGICNEIIHEISVNEDAGEINFSASWEFDFEI